MAQVPVVLTIAGFDPSSGAGVTADLKTIAAHGMYGVACITALTVQSTQGVRSSEAVSPRLVRETLTCLRDDVHFAAIKIGMMGSAGVVEEVVDFLAAFGASRPPVVLDPVLRSTSGSDLLDAPGLELVRARLLLLVDWVTPNVGELARLLEGYAAATTPEDARESQAEEEQGVARRSIARNARLLQAAAGGAVNVVVTGGDLDPPDDYLLTVEGDSAWLAGKRVETVSTHGTGCAFSTWLACRLATGDGPEAAARAAKEYVAAAISNAYIVGKGHGPLNHLWNHLERRQGF